MVLLICTVAIILCFFYSYNLFKDRKFDNEKDRIKSLLELHYKSKDKKYKEMIIEEMYVMFGVIKRPTHELLRWWREE